MVHTPAQASMRVPVLSAVALTAALAGACGEPTTPAPPLPWASVTLDFCGGSVPIWLAVQNEGDGWRQVTPGASGAFTFDATPKVSVAYVRRISGYTTNIYNVTRDELEIHARSLCVPAFGTKSLNGSVAGVAAGEWMQLSMGDRGSYANPNAPTFSIQGLADAPTDLVATRMIAGGTPDRVIVRRGLNSPTGTTIATLDFGSAEAHAITAHTVTIANGGNDILSMFSQFISASGTRHYLGSVNIALGASTARTVAVPALHAAGDLHRLYSFASGPNGGRDVTTFAANPTGKTLTLGPALSFATVSYATTPYVRPRLTIPSQAEYPSAMEAHFFEHVGCTTHGYTILTSAGFMGGRPATWELELPDMTQADYQILWAPHGTSMGLQARGVGADTRLVLQESPRDGDVIRQAFRSQ